MSDVRRPRPERATPVPPPAQVPDRVAMPLLSLIQQQSLDEAYQAAAVRRAAGAPRAPNGRPPRVAAAVLAVFGVLVAVAFVQTTRNRDIDSESRAILLSRIEAASDRRAGQEERLADLRTGVTRLERAVRRLTDQSQEATSTALRLRVATGFVPVTGEGVRVTVRQAPDADEQQQVTYRDLRLLTNGLYAAGAEAIAVNGQRVAVTSAIRTSGEAIEVNFVGIAPPYRVEAVGDSRTLPGRFAATSTGASFAANAEVFGFTFVVDNVDDLALPAAPASQELLTFAKVPSEDDQTIEQRGPS